MEPVDPNEAPDYYKVIKEPMGKNIFMCMELGIDLLFYSGDNISFFPPLRSSNH